MMNYGLFKLSIGDVVSVTSPGNESVPGIGWDSAHFACKK